MLVWLIVLLTIAEGCYCSNSTQQVAETNITFPTEETTKRKIETIPPVTSSFPLNSTNLNQTDLEVVKIFHEEPNITTIEQINVNNTPTTDFPNVTSTFKFSVNDTFSTNYSLAGVVANPIDVLPFRLPNWAAIAAGVCLVSGVIGYISCVSYRRFLQRKYGNSQILVGEDVYDTSDLRNFEI